MLNERDFENQLEFATALMNSREFIVKDKSTGDSFYFQPEFIDRTGRTIDPVVLCLKRGGELKYYVYTQFLPEPDACNSPEAKQVANFALAKGCKINCEGPATALINQMKKEKNHHADKPAFRRRVEQ